MMAILQISYNDFPETYSCDFSSLRDKEALTKEFESIAKAGDRAEERYLKCVL